MLQYLLFVRFEELVDHVVLVGLFKLIAVINDTFSGLAGLQESIIHSFIVPSVNLSLTHVLH